MSDIINLILSMKSSSKDTRTLYKVIVQSDSVFLIYANYCPYTLKGIFINNTLYVSNILAYVLEYVDSATDVLVANKVKIASLENSPFNIFIDTAENIQ